MKLILVLFLSILFSCAEKNVDTLVPTTTTTTLIRVLILGDSISMGYTPKLQNLLNSNNGYSVKHTIDNNRNTFYTYKYLSNWIANTQPDPAIVVWNNGIWDSTPPEQVDNYVKYMIENGIPDTLPEYYYRTEEEYAEYLHLIARKLKSETSARIFFALTTEMPYQSGFLDGREKVLNVIAKEVMQIEDIEVIDLYSITANSNNHLNAHDVHFNDAGYEAIATFVKDKITNDNN